MKLFLSKRTKTFLLRKRNFSTEKTEHFDLIVIGAGSGGTSVSTRASKINPNLKICVLDYVKPTPKGTKWNLGGTCVNVGCIPKKLMHQAGIINETVSEYSNGFGFNFKTKPGVNWNTLTSNISSYIKSIQFGTRSDFKKNNITFKNAFAKFINSETIEIEEKNEKKLLKATYFVIATGGRPKYPENIPGAIDHAITSDDLFSLKKEPKKTLIIGGSYIALETASFLRSLGYDTSVLLRSIPLRGFDQECALKIKNSIQESGTKFLENVKLTEIKRVSEDEYKVIFEDNKELNVNTVMFAIGRRVVSSELNLKEIGMKLDGNEKILVNENNETSIKNIFAIGDIVSGSLELTPVAIFQGRKVAKYLFENEKLDHYSFVPTTIFTSPLEYGTCGYTEESAIEKFGEENIEIYHLKFTPLEWKLNFSGENKCFLKMICNKLDGERVIGFHLLSPNAGEILQGVSVAMNMGAKKEDFDSTIGIHPTIGEEMTINRITKSSNEPFDKGNC